MRTLLLSFILLFAHISYSQVESQQDTIFEPQEVTRQDGVYKRDITYNEVSIGALNLVVFGALDFSYERIMTPNSSWAVETFFKAFKDSQNLSDAFRRDFSLTGKVKYYFSDQSAWGFYANGLSMINTGNYQPDFDGVGRVPDEERYTDLALGFGVGGKFVAKQGFFIDLSTGIGRNLFSQNSPTIVGQFNANMGIRF